MNNEQVRRQSEIDSRRVSTGVVCRVIREAKAGDDMALNGLLPLLKKYGYFPDNLGTRGFPEDTGICPASGIAFVVPRHMLDFFEQEIAQLVKDLDRLDDEEKEVLASQRKHSDTQLRDMEIRSKRIEQHLLHNLADNIFMVTIDPKTISDALTGATFDIFVNTREQQESAAILIRRNVIHPPGSVDTSWVKDVEAAEDANKRWREIQRNVADMVKGVVQRQKEEEIDRNGQPIH